jgi:hypothetical protein
MSGLPRDLLNGLLLVFFLFATGASPQKKVSLISVTGSGNFQTGGVLVTVNGDSNRNASVTLEWRVAGGTYQPGHPLIRVDSTHFVGSVFQLTQATTYDVRVTFSDPDGVSGSSTAVTQVQTRADALVEPTLRTLYVAPTGDDANPGTSSTAPLRTIQRAADLATAGDLVLVQPGVYRETVTVRRSGTASQPIVFRGTAAGVVIDGSDAAIAAGVVWTAEGNGIYSRVTGFPTGNVVTERGRLFRYTRRSDLAALPAGAPGGFYFDGTTLRVKFADGSSPTTHSMWVGRREQGFVVDRLAFIRIENFEIRYTGAGAFGTGVYLRYSTDCAVRDNQIHEVGSMGVQVKGGDRNLIEQNEIWDTSIFGWPWQLAHDFADATGVALTNEIGRGMVVRENVLHDLFDGVVGCGSTPPPSGFTSETDIHENVIYGILDDAIEPEGYCSNVRLFDNRISDVHMAVAAAPAEMGPLWVVRNIAWRFGNTRSSQLDQQTSSSLKINSSKSSKPSGPILVYHNTLLTDVPDTNGMALQNPSSGVGIFSRNNVIAGTYYALYKPSSVPWSGDGDDLYTTDPTRFVSWQGTAYKSLAAFRAIGQELNGIAAAPQLLNPVGGDFTPSATSPLIDRGLVIPGINDGYSGAAPDIGAVERTN